MSVLYYSNDISVSAMSLLLRHTESHVWVWQSDGQTDGQSGRQTDRRDMLPGQTLTKGTAGKRAS